MASIDNLDPLTASVTKLKAFVAANDLARMLPDKPTSPELRVVVARRLKRKKLEQTPELPINGVVCAMSLSQFKARVENINARNYGPKDYLCLNAKCIHVEQPVTINRHSEACRGVVKNGVCSVCKESAVGEPAFYITLVLQDLEDKTSVLNLTGYKAAAEAIFGKGKSPVDVLMMHVDGVNDILESWSEVAINVHAVVEYDMTKGKARISPYNLARLSIDYLTEYV